MATDPKGSRAIGRCWSLAALAMLPLLEIELITPEQNPDDASTKVQIFMICLSGLVGIATWLFFLWGVKDKQFEDVEGVAARIPDLDENRAVETETHPARENQHS